MKFFNRFKIRTGILIFIIFSSVAFFEYLRTRQFTGVVYFGILALCFLLIDKPKKKFPVVA